MGGRSQGVMYGLGVRVTGEEVSAWSEGLCKAGTGSESGCCPWPAWALLCTMVLVQCC